MILVCAVMKISEVECRWPGWRIWEDFSLMRWSFLMLLPQGDMRCAVTMLQTAVSFYTQVLRWFATYAQCVPVMSCLLLVQTSLVLTSWDILRYLDISWYIKIYLDISWYILIILTPGQRTLYRRGPAPRDRELLHQVKPSAAQCGWWANSAWCQVAGAVPESRTMALLREARSAQSTDQVPLDVEVVARDPHCILWTSLKHGV